MDDPDYAPSKERRVVTVCATSSWLRAAVCRLLAAKGRQ